MKRDNHHGPAGEAGAAGRHNAIVGMAAGQNAERGALRHSPSTPHGHDSRSRLPDLRITWRSAVIVLAATLAGGILSWRFVALRPGAGVPPGVGVAARAPGTPPPGHILRLMAAGHWQEAAQALSHAPSPPGPAPLRSAGDLAGWSQRHRLLAGCYALAGRPLPAAATYALLCARTMLPGPLLCMALCAGGLLWWRHRMASAPAATAEAPVHWLWMMCLIPLMSYAWTFVANPLACWLVYGNPGWGLVNPAIGRRSVDITAGAFVGLLLALAALTRQAGEPRAGDASARPAWPAPVPASEAGCSRRTLRLFVRALFLGGVTVAGFVLVQGPTTHWQFGSLARGVAAAPSIPAWPPLACQFCAIAVAEELVFRRLVQRVARQHLGRMPGALFAGLLFAGAHNSLAGLPLGIWIGVVYGVQYELARSLAPSMVSHGVGDIVYSIWQT